MQIKLCVWIQTLLGLIMNLNFCCKTQTISSADSPPILYLEIKKGERALLLAPVLLFKLVSSDLLPFSTRFPLLLISLIGSYQGSLK